MTRILMLAILMAAQSLLLVHEVNHLSTSDATRCAVCQIGNSLAGPSNDSAAPAVVYSASPVLFGVKNQYVDFPFSRSVQARAPPYVLFSV